MLWSALLWGLFASGCFAGVSALSLVGADPREDLAVWRGAGLFGALTFLVRLFVQALRKK
jgi:hypothetical protein